jgi:alpha-L-fucosidase 2
MRLKKYSISAVVLVLFSILITDFVNGQNPLFKVESNYLSRHDIVYQTPAYEGFEGFPIGNGDLGGMVWNTSNGIEVQINKNDLFDQSHEENRSTLRGGARLNIDFGAPGFDWIFLDDFDGRLSLQNAEVILKSKTPFMENNVISWVAPGKNVWCFQIKSKSSEPSERWHKNKGFARTLG